MNPETAEVYRAPDTLERLSLEVRRAESGRVVAGTLRGTSKAFDIHEGIPYFHNAETSDERYDTQGNQRYYQSVGDLYDAGMDWLFASFYETEAETRAWMVDLLDLKSDARVLETGCGTCRDSTEIRRRLDNGILYVTDISPNMLRAGRYRMEDVGGATPSAPVEYFVADATRLPFEDGYFDAVYHFGGINEFDDVGRGLTEMARVTRIGGKVVVGDEAIAPWLRDSEYGRILASSNPLYLHTAPLHLLPAHAEAVTIRWFLGNAFYLIDFRVGEAPPRINLDLEIPGRRGGTHRTRYYGRLEGVDPEVKTLVERAARHRRQSYRLWIESALRAQAKRDLDD